MDRILQSSQDGSKFLPLVTAEPLGLIRAEFGEKGLI